MAFTYNYAGSFYTNIDQGFKNFLTVAGVKDFNEIDDKSVEKIKKESEKIKKLVSTPKTGNNIFLTILTNIKCSNLGLSNQEKVLLLILSIDPECYTLKYYLNADIPDTKAYKDLYSKETDLDKKEEYRLEFERLTKKKMNELENVRIQVKEKVGIFLPSLIKYEKMYINRNKKLEKSTKINSFKNLNSMLAKIDEIKCLSEDSMEKVDKILENYRLQFPKTDINLLLYHIFNQSPALGLKSISEQLYFLINACKFGYNENETLAAIYEYYCNWDMMNEELKRVYGYSSLPLLKLQSKYNSLYNIKGSF